MVQEKTNSNQQQDQNQSLNHAKMIISEGANISNHNLDDNEVNYIANKFHNKENNMEIKGIDYWRYPKLHNKPFFYSSYKKSDGNPIPMPGLVVGLRVPMHYPRYEPPPAYANREGEPKCNLM